MSLKVAIEGWGENCGPQPKSYSSSQVRMVDVDEQGGHLIFSTGGVRTDRCSSPNPKLHTVSESVSPGRWNRVCETSPDDPKYEKTDGTLASSGTDRLEYRVKSRFDWTLKGDHCVAVLDERRVYERAEPSGDGPKARPEPEPVQPGCEQHGATVKLVVQPKSVRIGPGERMCFRALGVDERGCRFPVAATWSATQEGEDAGRLLAGNGCFSAGATAADSEGLYEIAARAENRKASAQVTVAYPDLGDLLAARLEPLQDAGGPRPEAAAATPVPAVPPVAPTPAAVAAAPAPAPAGSRVPWIALIAVLAVLACAGGVLAAVLLRRSRRARTDDAAEDDWGDEESARSRANGGTATAGLAAKPLAGGRDSENNVGMICPKCHRGYDGDARFCPHDSEKLMPYPEWRASNRNR
ncbi:MAG: hypothetical protein PHU25_18070 [Deltaproteobacteria bacterium]|nr:hypothetical protein [Deltaproteobacteria bacterium]